MTRSDSEIDDHERTSAFRFEYEPPALRFGADSVDGLEDELERRGFERAMIVCGSTVGGSPDVIDPVKSGLGSRLATVFDETTPKKRLGTAFDGLERLHAEDVDVLISLGGGSSLDVAKVLSTLAASGRSRSDIGAEFSDRGTITVPDEGLIPIVAIPTTLAGADLSQVAGVTASPESGLVDEEIGGGISGPELMPTAAFYDPSLVATTPESILSRSVMNGFDKGVETVYANNATPVTDATASRGIGLLADGIRSYGRGDRGIGTFETLLEGTVLVQYGISRPGETTLSVVHSFGHGLTRTYDVQQGAAHAIVVPHVLEFLFDDDAVDARVTTLAAGLGVDDAADPAKAVLECVMDVRDALGLPTRLRDVDGPARAEFPAVAKAILADSFMANAPPGFDPDPEEIEGVLERAW
ncbi:iron-containing alcohol dehydrogenase [Natrarchaeobius halalkaliphilus]|uniref:Iron-containing alcohol dehydrogenase n=1 Tax=Natrarchaeobius halalkaliphilus TaxID=1679091 RepID=A0A3N6P3H3_9EURY|nr:iron-containing alcohol dehydrogenase family protein [Natrarchaeobius halalkaliphilus]RQG89835.1 iron-containing alcohol dehydrogenase [Natrarchaeobius halalkaliphilus]